MRIVITGASGNVGTALLRILPAEDDVVGVVRRPPAPQGVYQRADWCALDLTGQGGIADLRRVFEGADVVFEGVATSSKEPLIIQSSGDPVEVTFSVENTLKGALPSQQVTVTTALSGASCGAEFQVGERWRVFAYGSRDNLESNLCAGNRLLGAATATEAPLTPNATSMLLLGIGAVVLMIAGLAFGLLRSIAAR